MNLDRRTLLLAALGAAGSATLAACTTPDPTPVYPQLTFQDRRPISLDVASIETIDEVAPPLAAPNVEHLAPVTPAAAAERWAADVLRAGGASGRGVFAIRQGSIVEQPLEPTGGLKGMITIDQAARYVATIVGQLDLYDSGGQRIGLARAEAERSNTIAENASLTDRERLWYDLVEKTSRDFAVAMETAIQRELARYVL